jgi:hypothetical protein
MARSIIDIAEHKAPVSKVDRISFVILLSESLLHPIFLLVEINCVHGFRKKVKLSRRKYVQSRAC